ncbi:hypothetical protein [Persicitalea sp.]|uniref:hypothetical protein n=1 Tax=Persicitalea sp. TaxID=3100273 RepID=UPI003593A581
MKFLTNYWDVSVKQAIAFIISAVISLGLPLAMAQVENGIIETVAGSTKSSRVRIAAGDNGEFHMVWLKPIVYAGDSIQTGCILYSRFRNGQWDKPLAVTDTSANSIPIHFPEIAADKFGNAYVVWVNQERNRTYFAKVSQEGKTTVEKPIPTRNSTRADVVVDALDTLRIMWREKGGGEKNYFYSRSINSSDWDRKTVIPREEGGQRRPSITADHNGNVHFNYRWMTGGPSDRNISGRIYNGFTGQWSNNVYLTKLQSKPWGPEGFFGATGDSHLVWYEGNGEDNSMCYRDETGKDFFLKGHAGGEDSYPPSGVKLANGKVILISSTDEKYARPNARGNVYYWYVENGRMASPVPIDHTSTAQGWGQIASGERHTMIVWVADEVIKYRLLDIGTGLVTRGVFNITRPQEAQRFKEEESIPIQYVYREFNQQPDVVEVLLNGKLIETVKAGYQPSNAKVAEIGTHTLSVTAKFKGKQTLTRSTKIIVEK